MFRPCLVCNTVSGTVKGNYSNTRSCLSTTDGPLHCTAPTPAGGAEAPAQRGARSPSLQSISVHTTPPVQFLPSHMESILKPNPHAEQNFFPETPLPGPRSQPQNILYVPIHQNAFVVKVPTCLPINHCSSNTVRSGIETSGRSASVSFDMASGESPTLLQRTHKKAGDHEN
jgi:hypothetical protein